MLLQQAKANTFARMPLDRSIGEKKSVKSVWCWYLNTQCCSIQGESTAPLKPEAKFLVHPEPWICSARPTVLRILFGLTANSSASASRNLMNINWNTPVIKNRKKTGMMGNMSLVFKKNCFFFFWRDEDVNKQVFARNSNHNTWATAPNCSLYTPLK